MRLNQSIRSILLAGSALGLLAACTEADVDDIVSAGSEAPITIVIPNVGVGSGGSDPVGNFAGRATVPLNDSDCPDGTTFLAGAALVDGAGNPSDFVTNFCSLTPLAGGAITSSVTIPFSADPILISGPVEIGRTDTTPVVVEVAAGQVFISNGANAADDVLIVQRGSQLIARGSVSQPIIFTSMEDIVDNSQPDGTGNTGDWGGLVINGGAPLNDCEQPPLNADPAAGPAFGGSADCQQFGEGDSGLFGGDDPADNSGVYSYVRVQHAGVIFNADNELNGVAFQGVGNMTQVDHVQVHDGDDDGFEWFGGTVNASHLVVTGAADDSFDWTDGWSGNLQFALAVQSPGNDNGIEGDGESGSEDAEPFSSPDVSNITLIGDGDGSGEGIELREGTRGNVINAIAVNFGVGFDFDQQSAVNAEPGVQSILIAGNDADFGDASDSPDLFNAGANNTTSASIAGAISGGLGGVLPGPDANAIDATDPMSIDSALMTVDYIGAFAPTDTPANNFTSGWTVPGSIPGAQASDGCPAGTSEDPTNPPSGFPGRTESFTCVLPNIIATNTTLTPGNLYRIDGQTFVGVDMGPDPASPAVDGVAASLTIESGVTLFAANGDIQFEDVTVGGETFTVPTDATEDQVAVLIISRGSQFNVNGSEINPVVLTSLADIVNGGAVRPTATGEWGGLVINGRAPLNDCEQPPLSATPPSTNGGTVNCQQFGEGDSGLFGGATLNDDSGNINFMQVRYAGFLFDPDNELNSIALQGAGSGTELDFVQVLNGADDGIEWFGGAANVRHAIITGANDDSFDWTDGWVGALQFGIVAQGPSGAGQRYVTGDNGIEGDGESGAEEATPLSQPFVSNVTLIGDGDTSGEGVELREGTDGVVANFVVTNFNDAVDFDDQATPSLVPTLLSGVVSPIGEFDGGDDATLLAASSDITQVASADLEMITGFSTPLAPGANVQAANSTAVDPFDACVAEFGFTLGSSEGNDADGDEINPDVGEIVDPLTNRAFPAASAPRGVATCNFLSPGSYIGALADEDDTFFAGWTIGL